ncbi:exodeoxyribonuclease VII small subunit [Nitrincola sp.]|uniref:exodeoxyribonuclease VII small subunit n=1 Tax=Nitrincola sp. TaxID=1926584 RepID=UPI003A946A59
MSDTDDKHSFETSMQRLEALVSQMEEGKLSIEESLQAFEEGIRLTRQCQQTLEQAEQKVKLLTEEAGEIKAVPFESHESNS